MDWPEYTVADLARYSGRPEITYPVYADQAIFQATFLFQIASALVDFPVVPRDAQLIQLGILSMADLLVLSQPHQAAIATPFQTESIGSYSYSKAQKAVSQGLPTGVSWFDMAVGRLGVGIDNVVSSEAITVFERDYPYRDINGRGMVRVPYRGSSNYSDTGLVVGYAPDGMLVHQNNQLADDPLVP